MSDLDKKTKEKSSFPAYEAIIAVISLYLLYHCLLYTSDAADD